MESPVLYTFILYFLFITLPLIPSILIYKIFPDTKMGSSGILGNLKFNATGAFAGYIVVSVLSFFIVQYAQGVIRDHAYQTWEVSTNVKFEDANGRPIHNTRMAELTDINVLPSAFLVKNSQKVKFLVTGKGRNIILTFGYPGDFDGQTFDLSKDEPGVTVNEEKRTIDLGSVVLKQVSKGFSDSTAIPAPAAMSGPPIITVNESL
jgi:hypothetical protein